MKNGKCLYLLALLLFLSACKQQVNYVLKVQMRELHAEHLYNREEVEAVMFDKAEMNSDSLLTESQQLFLKGAEALRNKKQAREAVGYFKKSILTFPQSKTYYELGNALFNLGDDNLAEARKAYEIADDLGYEPASHTQIQLARIAARQEIAFNGNGYSYSVLRRLELAFSRGFRDTAALSAYPELKDTRNHQKYGLLVLQYLKPEADEKNTLDPMLALFVKGFGPEREKYEIDSNALMLDANEEAISYDFKTFIPEMENMVFSRDVSHQYYYVARLANQGDLVVVLYGAISFWEEMSPTSFYVSVFEPGGKRLSSMEVACNCNIRRLRSLKVDGNRLYIDEYARNWAHDPDKTPLSENVVLSYELSGSESYRIEENGAIVLDTPGSEGKQKTAGILR